MKKWKTMNSALTIRSLSSTCTPNVWIWDKAKRKIQQTNLTLMFNLDTLTLFLSIKALICSTVALCDALCFFFCLLRPVRWGRGRGRGVHTHSIKSVHQCDLSSVKTHNKYTRLPYTHIVHDRSSRYLWQWSFILRFCECQKKELVICTIAKVAIFF